MCFFKYNLTLGNATANAIVSAVRDGKLCPTGHINRLSVEGQVHELIEQATSVSNISRMWIGWSAYY